MKEKYDISGNRLAYNALNGYNSNALISYTLSANTNYRVRVKFMDSNMEGRIKVAFTPARNISQFEDIISFNEVSSLNTYEVVPYINYINIFTYTSATTRSVTFYTTTVDGLTDYENTYLYIIDPSSTSFCTNYNDNSGGNNQAYLQVTLTANIPYIIIASLYDLSVSADDYNLIIA